MSKAAKYIHEALASGGFAVIDAEVAATLRPDLWSRGGAEAGGDLLLLRRTNQLVGLRGVHRMTVRLRGIDRDLLVLTRSLDLLDRRIQWVTGREVVALEHEIQAPAAPARNDLTAGAARRAEEDRLRALRALAEQEPPSHDCSLRREILRAREEVARLDRVPA